MNDFSVINLGRISDDSSHKIKFVLFNNGVLLFGKVEWHKDLVNSYAAANPDLMVIAAGTVPRDIDIVDLSDENWGGWKSTGYKVHTPPEYRERIRNTLLPFKVEIAGLSK